MTQAFVQKTAKFSAAAANSVTSAGLNTTTGNQLIVTCASWRSGGATVTVTDSQGGGSWANSVSVVDGGDAGSRATIATKLGITGAASNTATVTSSSGASDTYFNGNLLEFSGTLSAAALDVTANSPHGAAGTTCTPTTGSTAQADELVVACISVSSSTANVNVNDPPSGYTSIGVNQDSNATIGYQASYKIVSAIAAQSATWTFNATTVGDVGVIATYKAAPTLLAGTFNAPRNSKDDDGFWSEVKNIKAWFREAMLCQT